MLRLSAKTMNYMLIPGLLSHRVRSKEKRHTLEEIAEAVSKRTAITVNRMKMNSRRQEIVEARQIVFYIATMIIKPGYTTIEAGAMFFKDHSTVIHARKRILNIMDTDVDFQYMIMNIINDLHLENN